MKPERTAAQANMAGWRLGQGSRIKTSKPHEVFKACEHMARGLAPTRNPLRLEEDELIVCMKRALSQERNKTHPDQPLRKMTADVWWSQISAIAEQWGIKTTRDQWERSTTEKRKEAA